MFTFRESLRYVAIPNGPIMDDPTNMIIVGDDPVILIDPGSLPGLESVLETLDRLSNPGVDAILLTHIHVDHGESADELRRMLNAPVRFHLDELPELATSSHAITLDEPIEHGEIIAFAGFEFEAVLTPGHAVGHISFIERNNNFGIVGDLITGWGSSAIFPPYGDLSAYVDSMRRIADRGTNPLLPSHGDPVTNGPEALQAFVRRRLQREEEILNLLADEALPLESIRDRLYDNIPQDLIGDINGNVLLHLEKLEDEDRVVRRSVASGAGSVWCLPVHDAMANTDSPQRRVRSDR
jgi:endoribonuclease LACTB2